MSRTITSAMETAVTADLVRPIVLVQCAFDSGNLNLWSGIGDLTVDSVDYVGAGTLLQIGDVTETTDLSANGLQVTLSGITSPLIEKARDEDYQGRELKVLLGAMDASNGVISDPLVVFSGFMDTMTINDGGETATITVTVENRLIEFEKSRVRRYTAEDQKIDYPNDKGLQFVADMQEVEIVWGRANASSGGGGGMGQCLVAGTMIQTADGQVPIESLKEGDTVIGQEGENTVTATHCYTGRLHEIVNINHGLIVMTSTHPVLTDKGWAAVNQHEAQNLQDEIKVKQLSLGASIVFADGETTEVTDIFKQYIPVNVYSLQVDNDHTYIANGIVTHNK